MRIAVVGAGTAGCAACLFFERAGRPVTLFEQAEEPDAVGAGLLLQPTGLHVLHALGLLDPILEKGARVERLRGVTPKGRVVMDLPYAEIRPGLFGLGVHRGLLFRTLFGALDRTDVRCGVRIAEADGDVLVDEHGGRHGPFGLIVVADGSRSVLRERSGLVTRTRSYRWAALWAIVEAEPQGGELWQVYRDTRRLLGLLPTGRLDGAPLTSLFWSIRADHVEPLRAAGLPAFVSQVRELTDRADPVLEKITDFDQLLFASYRDVVMRRCYSGNVVFIGDAAHSSSPQLGQGANLALLDAMALAEHADDLAAFEAARRAQWRYYQAASRWLTPLFQSDLAFLGPPRDLLVPIGNRIPPVRRQSLATMAGIKTGLFSSMELEPLLSGWFRAS